MLAEPLTRKEIRVLHLLADGCSNPAISAKLFISDSTERTHPRNIDARLNSRRRMQAVAVDRQLGVVP